MSTSENLNELKICKVDWQDRDVQQLLVHREQETERIKENEKTETKLKSPDVDDRHDYDYDEWREWRPKTMTTRYDDEDIIKGLRRKNKKE